MSVYGTKSFTQSIIKVSFRQFLGVHLSLHLICSNHHTCKNKCTSQYFVLVAPVHGENSCDMAPSYTQRFQLSLLVLQEAQQRWQHLQISGSIMPCFFSQAFFSLTYLCISLCFTFTCISSTSQYSYPQQMITLPETNSEFTPENGWLEYDPFRWPIFRGKLLVSGMVITLLSVLYYPWNLRSNSRNSYLGCNSKGNISNCRAFGLTSASKNYQGLLYDTNPNFMHKKNMGNPKKNLP